MGNDYDSWDGRDRVMPFYLICDVSLSMRYEMKALQAGVSRLWRAIVDSYLLDEGTRVCVMTFSDEAKIPVPLTKMSAYPDGLPEFEHEQETNYGAAFRALAEEMAEDCRGLRTTGYEVFRPCVYFLTDGEPTDPDWHETFTATLTEGPLARLGMSEAAIFVPFGFRDARAQVLSRLAYPEHVAKWYHAKNATIEQALDGLLAIIKNSVLLSSASMQGGTPGHVLPEPEPGSGVTRYYAGHDYEA
jgi:uncharacterized protein YegL